MEGYIEEYKLKAYDMNVFKITDCPYTDKIQDCQHTEKQCLLCNWNIKDLEENIAY